MRSLVLVSALLGLGACHSGRFTGTEATTQPTTGNNTGGALAPPSALSYPSPLQAVVGTTIAPLTPTATGTVTGYEVSPTLPAGLSLDPTSGTISGTPTVAAAAATYTITASNASGSTSFALSVTVNSAGSGAGGSDAAAGPGTYTPVTTRSMIADALAQGRIDLPTSLLYRMWALFLDPQLPEQYDGTGEGTEDTSLFEEIQALWSTLPADVQAALQPYLVRPADPASPFSGGSSQATLFATRNGAVRGARASARAIASARVADNGTPQCADWVSTTADNAPVRVWVCHTSDAEDASAMSAVTATFDRHYEEMTYDMGPPLRDDGTGGDDLIDVYILDIGDCIQRAGACTVLTPPDAPQPPAALAEPAQPAAGVPGGRSGYMLVRKSRALAGGVGFESDVVHEFFHVLQYAHTANTVRIVVLPSGAQYFDKSWFVEASAKWAEWAYVPASSPTEVHLYYPADYDSGLHLFSDDVYQPGNLSLLEVIEGDTHQYASYIWPYFMQQELGGPEFVGEVWRSVDFANGPEEINRAINSELSFADHFRDFAVRNLNALLPGDPLQTHFWDMDVQFPQEQDDAHPVISAPDLYPPVTLVLGMQRAPLEVEIPNLAAQYLNFTVAKDSGVKHILLEFEVDEPDALDADAVGEVVAADGGNPTWKRFKSADGRRLEFCLADAEQDVDKFILIMSNHDYALSETSVVPPTTSGKVYVTADDNCGEWTGLVTYSYVNLLRQENQDALGTEVTQSHEVTTQSWAVKSVGTDPNLPMYQQLTLSWVGTDEVSDSYVLMPAGPCGGNTLRSDTTGTRSLEGTVFYDIYPGPNRVISLGPPYGTSLPASPSVTWTPRFDQVGCDGTEGTSDAGSRTLTEQFGAALALYGPLGGFAPDPTDPNHYFGSQTTQVAPGVTATVSWDLHHHATAQASSHSGTPGAR